VTPPDPIRRVLVVGKASHPEARRLASELSRWLQARKVDALLELRTAVALGRTDGVPLDALPEDLDLAVVVGGDGTLLGVARVAAPLGLPILGVNLGSLGFLTELQPEELFRGLEATLDGRVDLEEREALRVRPTRRGHVDAEYAVLNDAVIAKSALARMITLELRLDDDPVATYTADGLIVATPTGSTAYNLSAGGPILDPRMAAVVIAPICPHSMSYRPLVVPGTVGVEVVLRSTGEAVYLTLDGQIGVPLTLDDAVRIDRHPRPVRLVRTAPRSFFDVLRRKLRWGERPRG
jgi:NAD+ kinase